MPTIPPRLRRRGPVALAALAALLAGIAVVAATTGGGGSDDGRASPTIAPAPTSGDTGATPASGATASGATASGATVGKASPCVVELHGKGGRGSATTVTAGIARVRPSGNADGWGGRQWSYFPDTGYVAARTIVAEAITAAGCGRVVIDGFSNGAAFAAKLYCRGETFGGRLVGVMVDDPVTDRGVDACAPAAGIQLVLYWTGALEGQAKAGWNCAGADWTCEGGSTIGITAYARALGTAVRPSPNKDHAPYTTAPEPAAWLAS